MGEFTESWRNGQVVRKHIMENIRAENNAEHTWGVVMLLMCAWPDVPKRIIIAAQVHDCGERATGDMPGPIKWSSPVLEAEMDRLERQHITDTLPKHITDELVFMNESDWGVVEFFDRAEFCISMSRERRLGNTYAMIYFQRAFDKMTETLRTNLEDFRAKDPELARGACLLHREISSELDILKRGKF